MNLFALEHGKLAYYGDFALYGVAVAGLLTFMALAAPREHELKLALSALIGLLSWTLVEYVMHRFVLHGLQPFKRWHAEHHDRPRALICTPTILSAGMIMTGVYLPMLAVFGQWPAWAFTAGVTAGYLFYAITHHATHHGQAHHSWLKRRKGWHARHHHGEVPSCFGVTSGVWDYVFHSTGSVSEGAAG